MRATIHEALYANKEYSDHFTATATKDQKKAVAPLRRAAVVCCMDARIDPAKLMVLKEGDFHVIRNGGGRVTDDCIRSLVASTRLLGTLDWFIIHHTDCGFTKFTDTEMEELLETSTATSTYPKVDVKAVPGVSDGTKEGHYIKWYSFRERNLDDTVRCDVARLAKHPLVPKTVSIYGMRLDTQTAKLSLIQGAERAGVKEE